VPKFIAIKLLIRRVGAPHALPIFHVDRFTYRGVSVVESKDTDDPSLTVKIPASAVREMGRIVVGITLRDAAREHMLAIYAWPEGNDDPDTELDERWVLLTDPPVRGKARLKADVRFPRGPQ